MYSAIFESDNGQKYIFGKDGETVFDMDLGNGVTVNVGNNRDWQKYCKCDWKRYKKPCFQARDMGQRPD